MHLPLDLGWDTILSHTSIVCLPLIEPARAGERWRKEETGNEEIIPGSTTVLRFSSSTLPGNSALFSPTSSQSADVCKVTKRRGTTWSSRAGWETQLFRDSAGRRCPWQRPSALRPSASRKTPSAPCMMPMPAASLVQSLSSDASPQAPKWRCCCLCEIQKRNVCVCVFCVERYIYIFVL